MLFYLRTRPGRLETLGTLIGAFLLTRRLGLGVSGYAAPIVFLCYWSATAFVVSFIVPFFQPTQLAKRMGLLARMLAPPMFSVLSAVALLCVDALTSAETLDYYLYAADSSFGTQIGFAVARVLAHVEWLRLAAEAAYINLPVAVTVTYALLDADSPADAESLPIAPTSVTITTAPAAAARQAARKAMGCMLLSPSQDVRMICNLRL